MTIPWKLVTAFLIASWCAVAVTMLKNGIHAEVLFDFSKLMESTHEQAVDHYSGGSGGSIYAVNKISAEHFIKLFNQIYGVDYTIFRIAIPFGVLNPNAHEYGIVASLYNQALKNGEITLFGDGSGIRTFTHIEDLCNILYCCASMEEMKNEIFNIGGCTYSLSQIASMQALKTGVRICYLPWPSNTQKMDVENGCLDSGKLRKILDINYRDIKQELLGAED